MLTLNGKSKKQLKERGLLFKKEKNKKGSFHIRMQELSGFRKCFHQRQAIRLNAVVVG